MDNSTKIIGVIVTIILGLITNVIWDGLTNDFNSIKKAVKTEYKNRQKEKALNKKENLSTLSPDELCVKEILNSLNGSTEIAILDKKDGLILTIQSFDLIKNLRKNKFDSYLSPLKKTPDSKFQILNYKSKNETLLIGYVIPISLNLTKELTSNKSFENSKMLSTELKVDFQIYDTKSHSLIYECEISEFGLGNSKVDAEEDALSRIMNLFDKPKTKI